jgi:hypothetical protein
LKLKKILKKFSSLLLKGCFHCCCTILNLIKRRLIIYLLNFSFHQHFSFRSFRGLFKILKVFFSNFSTTIKSKNSIQSTVEHQPWHNFLNKKPSSSIENLFKYFLNKFSRLLMLKIAQISSFCIPYRDLHSKRAFNKKN